MKFRDFLSKNTVLLDGATATELQRRGLLLDKRTELYSLSDPDILTDVHKSYFDAGSNVVCTNTFGANGSVYGEAELDRIVRASLDCALRARELSAGAQPKFIALDLGPTGRMLQPYGDMTFEEAVEAFAKTVRLGAEYGADLIFIETFTDGYEAKAALLAAKENCDLPTLVCCAYGENGRLLTGGTPESVIPMLEGMGADGVGVNCSSGPEQLTPTVLRYLEYASVPVIFKPNAGLPENGVYRIGPEEFALSSAELIRRGVRVTGGCCGTTPEHIKAVSAVIDRPVPLTDKGYAAVTSGSVSVRFGERTVIIGERINPTGKKRFRQALAENDIGYVVSEGINQEKAGAEVLDVNVGIPQIDEAELLSHVVPELQRVTDLPLQIDTSSPSAMEAALRIYNGAPLINSVNGRRDSMDAIFPLVKKYGGVLAALTLDEDGIPETADGRVRIAKKILSRAEEYGIPKKRIIFDTLTMAVSADPAAPSVTLEAMRRIRSELGCRTMLGVSNVSFGLPQRQVINSAFFILAMNEGLDAAIINPYSAEMMNAYRAYNALMMRDRDCAGYIAQVSEIKEEGVRFSHDLRDAVEHGMRDEARRQAETLLESTPPLEVISRYIIPALDSVGRGFESGRLFLPQLLSAAEAAQSAFEAVKTKMPAGNASNGVFVLATVEGDIHDIGKNIVKLILENYGFDVHDLGKDVKAETVCLEVIKEHAPFAGLSALMTTTTPAMKKTVRMLKERAPWCRVIVGGAVLTEQFAEEIGADKYAKDAMETVRYALEVNEEFRMRKR